MVKKCNHPTCGEHCRRPVKPKKYYRIKPVSKKRIEENKVYIIKRKKFLALRPNCEIRSPVCTKKATVIHHKKGREGNLFLDETFWAASCKRCNNYVEIHDAWARANEFKLSKHVKHLP